MNFGFDVMDKKGNVLEHFRTEESARQYIARLKARRAKMIAEKQENRREIREATERNHQRELRHLMYPTRKREKLEPIPPLDKRKLPPAETVLRWYVCAPVPADVNTNTAKTIG